MNRISLVIIVKNGENSISRAIESAQDISEEIVIVDNNSTDRTIEVVKKFKPKIFRSDIIDDRAALRNFAISKARYEWLLILDSDEKLDQETAKLVPKLVMDERFDGYWIKTKTFISPDRYLKYGLFYPDYHLRLFRRNPKYSYIGEVHEQPNLPKGKTMETDGIIEHYPANPKYTNLFDFQNLIPYIWIQASIIEKQKMTATQLLWTGTVTFGNLFLGGYIRGKGFLDGMAGLRAHFMFSLSIASGYFLAFYRIIKPQNKKVL